MNSYNISSIFILFGFGLFGAVTAEPQPEENTGIAARNLGDANIGADPNVFFFTDDLES